MDETLTHFAVVGKSESGKTGLIVDLVEKLRDRGYSVSTVKHSRGDFRLDSEGTDTWEHGEAGADPVIFSTPQETSFIFHGEKDLDFILSTIGHMADPDIVLIEGMKDADAPKISTDDDIDARITSDDDLDEISETLVREIEIDKIKNELPGLGCGKCGYVSCDEFAEAVFEGEEEMKNCTDLDIPIQLHVNGKEIFLTDFPANMIKNGLNGLLISLKGVDEVKEAKIEYTSGKDDKE